MELKFDGKSTKKAVAVKAAFIRAYADILETAFDNLSEEEFEDVISHTDIVTSQTSFLYMALGKDRFKEKVVKNMRSVCEKV